jgi:hypothetical protein
MFFYTYNKLSPEQISEKLGSLPLAASVSEIYTGLAGKNAKISLDNGPVLDLEFKCESRLIFSEGGSASVEAAYKAMKIKEALLVTFMLPGTVRGWNLIVDTAARTVTAFEVWFCDYKDNREVQREIYYGYIDCDCGTGDPGVRTTLTNRIEGKGFFWRDDTGIEILNFYPSVMYSSFVEISNPRGGITISAPSDFIKISDNLFVYSRVECEYSGTLVLEVIDLFTVKNIGVRLGFDENDALDYRMYTSCGKITGQISTYEGMTDYGTTLNFGSMPGAAKKKGARPVYRPKYMYPPKTKEEVRKAIANSVETFTGESIMPGGNVMPLSSHLVGKKFTLRFDNGGPVWEYDIAEKTILKWRYEGSDTWRSESYQAFEPAENLIMFCHLLTGEADSRCVTFAVDFTNALVTCIDAKIGNWRSDFEVGHKAIFGVLEMDGVQPPLIRRHTLTNELTGKAFTWTYSDTMSSIHVYSSPESYSWTIFLANGSGGMMWSSPCIYVKLREDAYMMSWVEETCNGHQGTFVFNPRIMHDCGFFYGLNENGLHLTSFGAYARTAGQYDIAAYFDAKQR